MAEVNAELRIVMFLVLPVIEPPPIVSPSMAMLFADVKSIDMLAVAPGCSVIVTVPDFVAPAKLP
jgi:hypothetical protein